MSEPSEDEINETIAKFMGHKDVEFIQDQMFYKAICHTKHNRAKYTESLDALIPVIEKLEEDINIDYCFDNEEWTAGVMPMNESDLEYLECVHQDKTPSQALARACYEIIKEQKQPN